MKNALVRGLSVVILLSSAACTQQNPAEVVFKGSQLFSRERDEALDSPKHKTYSSDSPRYKKEYTVNSEPATVPVVSVSELPPPTETARHTQAQAQQIHTQEIDTQNGQQYANVARSDAKVSYLDSPTYSNKSVQVQQLAPAAGHVSSPSDKKSPFIWPVEGGKVISHYSGDSKGNDGINISMAEGEPIYASSDGSVVYADDKLEGYGKMIILRHKDGWMTAYAHAKSMEVKKGDKVKQGDVIGYVGTTGNVKKPQLHFVLRKGKAAVDPENYLPHNNG